MLGRGVAEREQTDRRRDLVRAAIRVFACKGFHAARVGDVTEEAGVAHGLLYHYFRSKEEVLETIFRETWTGLGDETRAIEEGGGALTEQIRGFSAVYLGSWLRTPNLIRVLIRELARNPNVDTRVTELRSVFDSIRRMIEAARERGEVRPDVDPLLATWALYGSLEQILRGWVLGQLPDGEDGVERAVASVVDVFAAGLAA